VTIASLAFITAFVVIAVGIGWPVTLYFDPRRALTNLERGLIAFGIGAIVFYLGIMAIGHWRLDRMSMSFLGAALALTSIPGLKILPWRRIIAGIRDQTRSACHDWFLAVLWSAAIVIGGSSLLQGMAPPNDYDSLMYHLAVPAADIERGHIRPDWARAMPHIFFPALASNLVRFGLAVVGEPVAQMFSGIFGIIAAFATGAIALRAGFGIRIAVLAGLMFLAIRAVVWEMGTAEVDVVLAAYAVTALLAYLAWRKEGGAGLAILFGLAIGGAINTKYQGFLLALAFVPVMAWDAVRHPNRVGGLILGPVASLIVLLPHLVRTWYHTGNPVFPLLNTVFDPTAVDFFADTRAQYGTGRDLVSVLRTPWDMFVLPSHYFDGVIFGAPYLLAFLPFGIAVFLRKTEGRVALAVTGFYYILWFYLVAQQVRFLFPIFPMLCATAAVGAAALWSIVQQNKPLKAAFAGIAATLTLNQAMFVGIYTALRLPPALGLVSPAEYHARTPTMQGAFYSTCTYIRRHLNPGERYLSLLTSHFYYCPQTAAIARDLFDDETRYWLRDTPLPEIDLITFVRRLDEARIRFVIIQHRYENRRNPTARPELQEIALDESRFGRFILPAIQGLTPLASDSVSAVYDGRVVIARLKAAAMDREDHGPSEKPAVSKRLVGGS
jgi:4-amino-4-deoxy-L-arabinose transferase-like glycosyltransferase